MSETHEDYKLTLATMSELSRLSQLQRRILIHLVKRVGHSDTPFNLRWALFGAEPSDERRLKSQRSRISQSLARLVKRGLLYRRENGLYYLNLAGTAAAQKLWQLRASAGEPKEEQRYAAS